MGIVLSCYSKKKGIKVEMTKYMKPEKGKEQKAKLGINKFLETGEIIIKQNKTQYLKLQNI